MSRLANLPRGVSDGLQILPPTLMVVMGYPLMGAATLGGVLIATAFQSRMLVRAAQERHRAILAYAQSATSMGSDPAPVITALQGRSADYEDDEPPAEEPARGESRAWRPWLHLPPSD
jgi:hypothetical protein